MKNKLFLFCFLFFSYNSFCQVYLGQTPPLDSAMVFAPGIVSDGLANRDITFMPDGKEIYWAVGYGNNYSIVYSKYEKNKWTEPQFISQLNNKKYSYLEPHISPDGKKLFFLSDMPDSANGKKNIENFDIWVMDRIADKWSKPYNLGAPVNTDQAEFYPTVTNSGTLYFCRKEPNSGVHYIYCSKLVDGKYSQPEKLPNEVNSGMSQFNAFIAPDESFIIVPTFGKKDTYGGCDYYISFKKQDGSWTQAVNMGAKINSKSGMEWSASLSPDGKYLFFMSVRLAPEFVKQNYNFKISEIKTMEQRNGNGQSDIYWIKTDFIEKLKQKALSN